MAQGEDQGQDHRPERVDVLDRVEGQPPRLLGGRVAETPGDETVRNFMEHDRDHQRDEPGRDLEQSIRVHSGHSSFNIANSTVSRTWPVQVTRSARSTPSRTAPSFFIAAWLRVLRKSTRNSTRRMPEPKARVSIMSLMRRLKPVPRRCGR